MAIARKVRAGTFSVVRDVVSILASTGVILQYIIRIKIRALVVMVVVLFDGFKSDVTNMTVVIIKVQ